MLQHTISSAIKYNRDTKDFSVYVDGRHIADVRSYKAGEDLVRETVYELLNAGHFDAPTPRHRRLPAPGARRCDAIHSADTNQFRQHHKRRRVAA